MPLLSVVGRPDLSWRRAFAAAGKSVAIIERPLFGGTCVNTGCTPTKTLIASARIAYDVRRARDFGIDFPLASVAVDMRAVHACSDSAGAFVSDGLSGSDEVDRDVDVAAGGFGINASLVCGVD